MSNVPVSRTITTITKSKVIRWQLLHLSFRGTWSARNEMPTSSSRWSTFAMFQSEKARASQRVNYQVFLESSSSCWFLFLLSVVDCCWYLIVVDCCCCLVISFSIISPKLSSPWRLLAPLRHSWPHTPQGDGRVFVPTHVVWYECEGLITEFERRSCEFMTQNKM